jgi:hypothetical protein
MNNLWTDERNRLRVEMVKAELCTKVNYSMKCAEFKTYVSDHKELINAVKSNKKYSFS